MTFTDRAMRHFEETYDMARLPMPGTLAVEMAEWAASIPPTDEEVEAGAEALWGLDHPESPFDSLADSARSNPKMAAFYRRLARAALAAAREARR